MGNMWIAGILFLLSLGFIIVGLIVSRTHDRAGKTTAAAEPDDAVVKFIEEKLPAEKHSFLRAWADFVTGADEVKQQPVAPVKKTPEELAVEVQKLMADEQNKGELQYQWHEIFRIVRHDDGRLAINVQGQYYPNLAAVNEWIHRETITELLEQLGITPAPAAKQPKAETVSIPTTTERIALKVGDKFYRNLAEIPDRQQREFVKTYLLGTGEIASPSPPPKSAFKLPTISLAKDKKAEAALTPPARGFLVEVQEILQRKMDETPEYRGGEVQLVAGASGELEIHTLRGIFHGVGEVPDPEIRELIAAAVREWENRPKTYASSP